MGEVDDLEPAQDLPNVRETMLGKGMQELPFKRKERKAYHKELCKKEAFDEDKEWGERIKNKEIVHISIKVPKWLIEEAEKACQNHRQFHNRDGTLNVNKFGIEAFILKVEEMKGDKVCVLPGMLVVTFPKRSG